MRLIWESRRAGPRLALAFVVAGCGAARARAAEVECGAGVRLAAGYDSNPLLVADDGPSGAFAQLDFDARLDVKPAPAIGFFVRSDGWSRAHGSTVGDADTWGGEARAGVLLPRLGSERRRASLAFGARAATRRDTFVNRSTGDVYQVAATPLTTTPIPDRYDSDTTGAFLNARWRLSPRVLLSLDGKLDEIDYRNDYAEVPSLGSLDSRFTSVEPGVYLKVADPFSVGVSFAATTIDYDRQPALDASGAAVPGTTRHYSSRETRFVVSLTPAGAWSGRLVHRRLDREDAHAGYYSYRAATSTLTFDRALGPRSRLQLQAVRGTLDYDHAVVPGATDGSIQASGLVGVSARYDRSVGPASVRWFSETGLHHADSRDPVYAYGRQWILTGFEFRR